MFMQTIWCNLVVALVPLDSGIDSNDKQPEPARKFAPAMQIFLCLKIMKTINF